MELLVDFVNSQRKPVVLVGMSIGGILAAEVAQRCPQVKRTVATCLVDCSDPQGEGSFKLFEVPGTVPALPYKPGSFSASRKRFVDFTSFINQAGL